MQNHTSSPSAYKKLTSPTVVLVLSERSDVYEVLCDGAPWLVMKRNTFLIEGDE